MASLSIYCWLLKFVLQLCYLVNQLLIFSNLWKHLLHYGLEYILYLWACFPDCIGTNIIFEEQG